MINLAGQMRFAHCYVWWTILVRIRTAFPQFRAHLWSLCPSGNAFCERDDGNLTPARS